MGGLGGGCFGCGLGFGGLLGLSLGGGLGGRFGFGGCGFGFCGGSSGLRFGLLGFGFGLLGFGFGGRGFGLSGFGLGGRGLRFGLGTGLIESIAVRGGAGAFGRPRLRGRLGGGPGVLVAGAWLGVAGARDSDQRHREERGDSPDPVRHAHARVRVADRSMRPAVMTRCR